MWPKHAGIICTSTLDTDGSHEFSRNFIEGAENFCGYLQD